MRNELKVWLRSQAIENCVVGICNNGMFLDFQQGRRKLFLVGGAEIEVWKPESSATGARLYRGNFLV